QTISIFFHLLDMPNSKNNLTFQFLPFLLQENNMINFIQRNRAFSKFLFCGTGNEILKKSHGHKFGHNRGGSKD
ncbi:MAG: hypothetical protein AMJ45_03670, partial [Syntrophobacter sp. DG_60]